MLLFACTGCPLAVRCMDLPDGVVPSEIPNSAECAKCGSSFSMIPERMAAPEALTTLEIQDLTFEELYYWSATGALPNERPADVPSVTAAMAGRTITSVGVDRRVQGATVVTHLVLDDGTRVYFGASPYGAVVYRLAGKLT